MAATDPMAMLDRELHLHRYTPLSSSTHPYLKSQIIVLWIIVWDQRRSDNVLQSARLYTDKALVTNLWICITQMLNGCFAVRLTITSNIFVNRIMDTLVMQYNLFCSDDTWRGNEFHIDAAKYHRFYLVRFSFEHSKVAVTTLKVAMRQYIRGINMEIKINETFAYVSNLRI